MVHRNSIQFELFWDGIGGFFQFLPVIMRRSGGTVRTLEPTEFVHVNSLYIVPASTSSNGIMIYEAQPGTFPLTPLLAIPGPLVATRPIELLRHPVPLVLPRGFELIVQGFPSEPFTLIGTGSISRA